MIFKIIIINLINCDDDLSLSGIEWGHQELQHPLPPLYVQYFFKIYNNNNNNNNIYKLIINILLPIKKINSIY